ncbi:hypothetical protein N0G65_000593 [Providencia rettgeri]|nr:hypothetical protein [Providencia rettgeri]
MSVFEGVHEKMAQAYWEKNALLCEKLVSWKNISSKTKKDAKKLLSLENELVVKKVINLLARMYHNEEPYKIYEKNVIEFNLFYEISGIFVGFNLYLTELIFQVSFYFHLAKLIQEMEEDDEKLFDSQLINRIVTDSLLKSLELINFCLGLNLFNTHFLKSAENRNQQLSSSAKKGGEKKSEVYELIRVKAVELISIEHEKGLKYKSKSEAAMSIEDSLWCFVEDLERQGKRSLLVREAFINTILRWERYHANVKAAFNTIIESPKK